MTDEPAPIEAAIARALQTATLATEAAEEAQRVADGHKAITDRLDRIERRAVRIGAAVGGLGVIALGLSGLVYFRSLGDLRDVAAIQAAAAEVQVARLVELGKAVDRLETATGELSARNEGTEAALAAQADTLAKAIEQASAVEPQFAASLQRAISEEIANLRTDLLAAMAEAQLTAGAEGGAPADAEVLKALADLRGSIDALSKAAAAKPAQAEPAKAEATAKPKSASSGTKSAASPAQKPKSRPATPDNPFRYP